MEFFLIILLLLAIIGLSNFINHFMPYIPVPLIQIVLAVILAGLPLGIHVPMEPELFFILFIAPLLFHDGKNVSRHELWKLRKPILLLALGLVFLTVFVIGYLIHWLIPSISLSAAFALAAILSPTDVVAVGAISSRVKMPKTIMHILEGEGLMNDASGLVAFKFAVAATVTGVFSLAEASWSFLVIAIGGLLGGAILAFLIIRLKVFLRRLGMQDVTLHMLIQLLTPFVVFYIIEHFHLSGILSVVAAGVVHAIYRDYDQSPSMQLQVVSKSTWSIVIYILNGLVFVLLGLQIPSVMNEIFENPLFNNFEVIKFIFIITTALLLLRFIWIYVGWWGGWLYKLQIPKPTMRLISITTISGVRGAVTLAGAFTIPYFLADGSPFPDRALIIFIAAGVILLTLILASIILPLLAKTEKVNTEELKEEMKRTAMIHSVEAAISAIRELMNDENREAAVSVISSYNQLRNRLKYVSDVDSKRLKLAEIEIRMKALAEEANYIEKLKEDDQIDRDIIYMMDEHIHRMSIAVTNRMQYRRLFLWTIVKRSIYNLLRLFIPKNRNKSTPSIKKNKKMIQYKVSMAKAAIQYLRNNMTPENEEVYLLIIGEYNEMIMKFKLAKKGVESKKYAQKMQREIRDKALQAERDVIQNLYENGEITMEVTRELRKQINIREAYWMEENSVQVH